jgi:DNA polymerase-1
MLGRRRYIPELKASNKIVRAFGERVARNSPIQGSAADIIKIAMIRVSKRLEQECPSARLILQVHDELLVEAPRESTEIACRILCEEMENAVLLAVKLSVEAGIGQTWYECK